MLSSDSISHKCPNCGYVATFTKQVDLNLLMCNACGLLAYEEELDAFEKGNFERSDLSEHQDADRGGLPERASDCNSSKKGWKKEWKDISEEVIQERYDVQTLFDKSGKEYAVVRCKVCSSIISIVGSGERFPSAIAYRCHTCGYNPRIHYPLEERIFSGYHPKKNNGTPD